MDMRKLVISLLVVALLALFVGCSSEARSREQAEAQLDAIEERSAREDPEAWEETLRQREMQPEMAPRWRERNIRELMDFNEVLERAISDAPLEQLLAEIEPFQEDSFNTALNGRSSGREYMVGTILSLDSWGTVDVLRLMDNDRMYTVQKSIDGGLLYIFFGHEDDFLTQTSRNAIYVAEKLTHSDMANLVVGDDISLVESIDPVAMRWRSVFEGLIEREREEIEWGVEEEDRRRRWDGNFQSKHLLTDGLLVIDYEQVGNSFVIENISFFDDFRVPGTGFHEGVIFDYSIRPEDYPWW